MARWEKIIQCNVEDGYRLIDLSDISASKPINVHTWTFQITLAQTPHVRYGLSSHTLYEGYCNQLSPHHGGLLKPKAN